VATPRQLAEGPSGGQAPIVVAVATAMGHLAAAGVALDAPLGAVQWAARGDSRVPVHGGVEADGVMNILSPTAALGSGLPVDSLEPLPSTPAPVPGRPGLVEGGYQVDYGTSFLMAVELTDDGPVGLGLLAYGQSGDPASPHHRDGTDAFAAKALRPLLFRDADIDADPQLVRRTVRS
jgi:acyl-homoserine-lactone acylase